MNSYKYPQNADDLVSHRYSLYQTVLLSYYPVSRCSLLIKTFPLCLIQATYYHASTHRAYKCNSNQRSNMNNIQVVQVQLTTKRVLAKYIKYIMLATITVSCLYSAMVLHAIASRLL